MLRTLAGVNAPTSREGASTQIRSAIGVWLAQKPTRGQDVSPLLYWESQKAVNPELAKIAQVVLGAPSTSCSVERLFSSLKWIYSDLRNRLKSDILDDILVLRANMCQVRNSQAIESKVRRAMTNLVPSTDNRRENSPMEPEADNPLDEERPSSSMSTLSTNSNPYDLRPEFFEDDAEDSF